MLTTASSGKPAYKPVAVWGALCFPLQTEMWLLSLQRSHFFLYLRACPHPYVLHPCECSFPLWSCGCGRERLCVLAGVLCLPGVICHHGMLIVLVLMVGHLLSGLLVGSARR